WQRAWFAVWMQSLRPSSQTPLVQGMPSLQETGEPAMHPVALVLGPASQTSLPSQKTPLEHAASCLTWAHVSLPGSQKSVVHDLASSQSAGPVVMHPITGLQATVPKQKVVVPQVLSS